MEAVLILGVIFVPLLLMAGGVALLGNGVQNIQAARRDIAHDKEMRLRWEKAKASLPPGSTREAIQQRIVDHLQLEIEKESRERMTRLDALRREQQRREGALQPDEQAYGGGRLAGFRDAHTDASAQHTERVRAAAQERRALAAARWAAYAHEKCCWQRGVGCSAPVAWGTVACRHGDVLVMCATHRPVFEQWVSNDASATCSGCGEILRRDAFIWHQIPQPL